MRKTRDFGLGTPIAGLVLALSLSLTGCPTDGAEDTSVPWLPSITPAQPVVAVGETVTLTVTGMPYGENVTWESSHPDRASVSPGMGNTATVGGLQATGATPARITARAGDFSAYVDIGVRELFAWTFTVPPPHGWHDALNDTGAGAQATTNDFNIPNNFPASVAEERTMRILGSHTGGIAWGSHAGRMQVRGINVDETYFLEIADVERPFSVTVFYADTANNNGGRFVTFYDGEDTDTPVWRGRETGFNQNQLSSTADFQGTGLTTVRIGFSGAALRIYGVVLSRDTSSLPPVASVALPPNFSIEQGMSRDLTATVLPSNSDNHDLEWMSSDPAVASVTITNSGGDRVPRLTAISIGTATITATSVMFPERSGTVQVEVLPPPAVESLVILGPGITRFGQPVTLIANVLPAHTLERSVTWQVVQDPPNIATYTSTGTSITLNTIAVGTLTVTATTVGEGATGQTIQTLHTVTVGTDIPLFRRVFSFGPANTAHVAGPAPTFADGRLRIQGSGTTDGNNFMGHLVWVGIPVSIATFDAELDLVLGPGGSSFGGTGNNTKIALFVTAGNPANGLGSEAAFNGWFNEFAASPRTSRAIRIFHNGGLAGTIGGFNHRSELRPVAESDMANPPGGATMATMRMRHGSPNINGYRVSITFNGTVPGGDGGVDNTARFPINADTDQVYVGIFVSSNNANLTTAVVSDLRILFDGDTDFTSVPLDVDITLIEDPPQEDD